MIELSPVRLGAEEERLVNQVLRSGRLAQGPMVERLERQFAQLAGCDHVVAVANGSIALEAALEALGIGAGDEVVTTPFTFVASVSMPLRRGARVRFADICIDDFCIDPARLAEAVTPSTRLILPVHLFGQPADMDAICAIASVSGAAVLEDAAQAHGARYRGRPVGGIGRAGVFSLYATKNLTAGEGGLITTNDAELAGRLRRLRNHGSVQRYEYLEAGHNWRLSDLHAALAVAQLAGLEETNRRRAENARRLSEGLTGLPGLILPKRLPERSHVWHQYTLRVNEEARLDRNQLRERLREEGIEAGVFYPRPIGEYAVFRHHPGLQLTPTPVAERVSREVLSLPVHQHLSEADVERIIAAVRELLCG